MSTERLRLVLRLNAATSFTGGLLALVAGPWLSRGLGIDHVRATRLIGVALVVFAVVVALAARAPRPRLQRNAVIVSAADTAWVIATAVVVVTGALSTTGVWVAVVLAVAVADFAAAQLWLRSVPATTGRREPTVASR